MALKGEPLTVLNTLGDEYYLHAREVKLIDRHKHELSFSIYYFTDSVNEDESCAELPPFSRVIEDKRNNIPILEIEKLIYPVFATLSKKNNKMYFLHAKVVRLRNRRLQIIYYFAGTIYNNHVISGMPDGFEIAESKKTGLPCVRRKR